MVSSKKKYKDKKVVTIVKIISTDCKKCSKKSSKRKCKYCLLERKLRKHLRLIKKIKCNERSPKSNYDFHEHEYKHMYPHEHHQEHKHHDNHCDDHHKENVPNHKNCEEPCDGVLVFKNCCIPFTSTRCNNPFNLRLAGLNQNLNFQLFGMKGCRVEIEYECQGTNEEVKGIICDIGTDFIAVMRDNGVVSTILKERICKIEWKDPCCNPCSCQCHGDHDVHGHCQDCGCFDNHHHQVLV